MAGVQRQVDISELDGIAAVLARIPDALPVLIRSVGALVREQTKERITTGKRSPSGVRWPNWSDRYAKTRNPSQSLLWATNQLQGSIHELVGTDSAEVGSELIYAATHNEGDNRRNIPQREFLGLSNEDRRNIEDEISNWLEDTLS